MVETFALAKGVVEYLSMRCGEPSRSGVAIDDQVGRPGPDSCWSVETSRNSGMVLARASNRAPRCLNSFRFSSRACMVLAALPRPTKFLESLERAWRRNAAETPAQAVDHLIGGDAPWRSASGLRR